jgi:hypothetical protein
MNPSRAASITAAVVWGIVALVLWSATADAPVGHDDRIQQLVAVAGLLGTPLAIAGAVLAYGFARAARGRDLPERILGLATAGLRAPRDAWGAAMRAELANIDDPRERRRFAVGCIVTAFRIGPGRGPWLIALGVGVVFAIGTFAASRATLAGGRGGIIGLTITWPPLVLFAVALLTALARRSFRTGLVSGILAMLAGLVGMLVVAMAEAAHWYDVAGVFLMDGDRPKGGLDRLDAVLNPASVFFAIVYVLVWTPWPVLGAAVGSWNRRRGEDAAPARRAT